jgi:uncharacterized membrane protein YfcA
MVEAIVFLGALAGGFVAGLAGFGTGLTALGIWLYVMKPPLAASLVIVCSVFSQIQTIPMVWHALKPRLVAPFILGGLAGVPIGTALVLYVDPNWFRFAIGIVLLVFSSVMLRAGARRPTVGASQAADVVVGFGGGVLGGLAGLSGPLPTMWAALRAWGKDQRRSVFQSFNLTILVAALIAHGVHGMLTVDLWRLVAVAIPGTFIGAWLGARLYRRLSDTRFQIVVLMLLGTSGVVLIATSALKFARAS